jgi:hypothetical protein
MGPDGVDEPAHKAANLTPARPLAGRSRTLTKRRLAIEHNVGWKP